MTDHPSIEGLREAVAEFECVSPSRHHNHNESHRCHQLAKTLLMKQATYLTEHGVGWFGEGLVRAIEVGVETPDGELLPFDVESRPGVTAPVARLVPVLQDGET